MTEGLPCMDSAGGAPIRKPFMTHGVPGMNGVPGSLIAVISIPFVEDKWTGAETCLRIASLRL